MKIDLIIPRRILTETEIHRYLTHNESYKGFSSKHFLEFFRLRTKCYLENKMFSSESLKSFVRKPFQDLLTIIAFVLRLLLN